MVRRIRIAVLAALSCAIASLIGALLLQVALASATEMSGPPTFLSQTGLYADIVAGRIAPDHLPYTPQYPLWSDGAAKRRWVHLPAGSRIETSGDRWEFPVGTRLFKEFALEHPVETRMLERRADGGWSFAAYVWDADGQEARLAPPRGVRAVRETLPGVPWDVPGLYDCLACHADPDAPVLGFTALQLSSDRDPLALHAEPTPGVQLPDLIARGWIPDSVDPAPRLAAATPAERSLRGYLRTNCGVCHGGEQSLADVGLHLDRATADDLRDPRILERMSTRDPQRQMPPLGTRVVDDDALSLLNSWREADPGPTPDSR